MCGGGNPISAVTDAISDIGSSIDAGFPDDDLNF